MRFECIVTVIARLFIDAVFALEGSVTDFWHAVHAILYTRRAFCSATNARASIRRHVAAIRDETFATQYENLARQHGKGFDWYHVICSGIPVGVDE
ncbi:hypothetical protein HED22_10235 [Thalassospira sp. HF15]|uniref:hypothetical protein n=1 Tax=Thalassospira sp. HF15 TaxID=2722755 RepID=UPI0014314EF9|nr:hypothetical protein [Thalassospira sp. HF15]NIY76022.1 hypothetical protein [Thalassospira sp. HF15]